MNKKEIMTRNNNKGFTLIELLVVVAIIGILAAVGVVAYSGYTTSAKITSSKSNHAAVVKYIMSELQKCNLGETTVMNTNLTCENKGDGGVVATAAAAALTNFKNPHSTGSDAVTDGGTTLETSSVDGNTVITDDGTDVQISTKTGKDDDVLTDTNQISG